MLDGKGWGEGCGRGGVQEVRGSCCEVVGGEGDGVPVCREEEGGGGDEDSVYGDGCVIG